jgi:hypothetical protein
MKEFPPAGSWVRHTATGYCLPVEGCLGLVGAKQFDNGINKMVEVRYFRTRRTWFHRGGTAEMLHHIWTLSPARPSDKDIAELMLEELGT